MMSDTMDMWDDDSGFDEIIMEMDLSVDSSAKTITACTDAAENNRLVVEPTVASSDDTKGPETTVSVAEKSDDVIVVEQSRSSVEGVVESVGGRTAEEGKKIVKQSTVDAAASENLETTINLRETIVIDYNFGEDERNLGKIDRHDSLKRKSNNNIEELHIAKKPHMPPPFLNYGKLTPWKKPSSMMDNGKLPAPKSSHMPPPFLNYGKMTPWKRPSATKSTQTEYAWQPPNNSFALSLSSVVYTSYSYSSSEQADSPPSSSSSSSTSSSSLSTKPDDAVPSKITDDAAAVAANADAAMGSTLSSGLCIVFDGEEELDSIISGRPIGPKYKIYDKDIELVESLLPHGIEFHLNDTYVEDVDMRGKLYRNQNHTYVSCDQIGFCRKSDVPINICDSINSLVLHIGKTHKTEVEKLKSDGVILEPFGLCWLSRSNVLYYGLFINCPFCMKLVEIRSVHRCDETETRRRERFTVDVAMKLYNHSVRRQRQCQVDSGSKGSNYRSKWKRERLIHQYRSFANMMAMLELVNFDVELKRYIASYDILRTLFASVRVCEEIVDFEALKEVQDYTKIYLIVSLNRSIAYGGKAEVLSNRIDRHRFNKTFELAQAIRSGLFAVCVVALVPPSVEEKQIFQVENVCNVFLRDFAAKYYPNMRVLNETYNKCPRIVFFGDDVKK